MKRNFLKILSGLLTVVILITVIVPPVSVGADGGPLVEPYLFAKLTEGQQLAVIRLSETDKASVDLFVSILDETGESHEITYFVPLGIEPDGLNVNETDSLTFNKEHTETLDWLIARGYQEDKQFVQYLFAGALLTNGVWLMPLWAPMLLTGCAESSITPVSSYTTESSQVDVFNIDETTDIDSLIAITGLDISVKDTLSRLQGQQIAVIKLNTRPHTVSSEPGDTSTTGEPGLHLSWETTLTESENGMTYAYPLGTGASWANPIEMTRVYVVTPTDINFKVTFPKLGTNRSGFTKTTQGFDSRITSYIEESAYAVDEAIGLPSYYSSPSIRYYEPVKVWRGTFTNSNSAEDVVITVDTERHTTFGTFLREQGPETAGVAGLIVAIIFWIAAWYFLVPRIVGKENMIIPGLWRISITYILWNLLLFVPGIALYFFFSFNRNVMALVFAFILFGAASVLIFTLRHMDKLKEISGKAVKVFALVTGASGGAYLLFAFGYAWLAGAI